LPLVPLHNEKELLDKISTGDEQAFELLFNHYYPLLRPLASSFSLTPQDIEETLQETFIRVWLHRDRLLDIENLQGWLVRVTSRECINTLRKNLRFEKQAELSLVDRELPGKEETHLEIEVSEIKQQIYNAIQHLPEQRRKIYLLSRQEGMKPAQIAEELSLSVSTVKNTLVVALKQIREYLSGKGYQFLFSACLINFF
jgi:RNA polymerase sigma-70 factor (family 1)